MRSIKITFLLVTDKISKSLIPTKYGKIVKEDCILTEDKNITLSIKPGDCTTVIVYAEQDKRKLTGIIHTGRAGVSLELPKKAIKYLTETLSYPVENIKIAFVPHLNKKYRIFETLTDIKDEGVWTGFIKKVSGGYEIDEEGNALHQYKQAGILEENIFWYEVDTFEANKNGESFSHKYAFEMEKAGSPVEEGRFLVVTRVK